MQHSKPEPLSMKETAAKLPSLGSNPLDDKNQPLPSI